MQVFYAWNDNFSFLNYLFEIDIHFLYTAGGNKEEFKDLGIEREPGAKRVLLVEDYPDFAQMIEGVLDGEGYKVTIVDSAEGASTLANNGYDVVISDLHLSGKETGEDLAGKVRTMENPPPVVLMSADFFLAGGARKLSKAEQVQTGINFKVAKPCPMERFLAVVKDCCNISPARMANVPPAIQG